MMVDKSSRLSDRKSVSGFQPLGSLVTPKLWRVKAERQTRRFSGWAGHDYQRWEPRQLSAGWAGRGRRTTKSSAARVYELAISSRSHYYDRPFTLVPCAMGTREFSALASNRFTKFGRRQRGNPKLKPILAAYVLNALNDPFWLLPVSRKSPNFWRTKASPASRFTRLERG